MRGTDDLISRLAAEGAARTGMPVSGRLTLASVAGFGLAALGAAWLGARPDVTALDPAAATWGKLSLGALVALAAGALASRLAAPGRPLGARTGALLGTGLLLAALALGAGLAPAAMGAVCAASIVLLSLPALAAALWAIDGRAVLRPGMSGAAAGVMAGAAGLAGFALHCPADAVLPMLGWYALALAILAAAGASAGARLAR